MKKIGAFLLRFLLVIYIIVALGITVCLLSFNDYRVSEFGDYSLVLITDEEMEPEYKEGDLVIVKKNKAKDINEGDKIFFYSDNQLNFAEVAQKEEIEKDRAIFVLEDNTNVVSDDVAGKAETSKSYSNIGMFLSIVESKWGFLFLIVFPSSIAFIYELYSFIVDIKMSRKK